MTFAQFETIVKEKYPDIELFKHGEFAGSKINVAVIFHPHGKAYRYNGTYCEVLNRLGIKAIYKHDVWNIEQALERYKQEHGKIDEWFGNGIFDYSAEIKEYEQQLQDIYDNYIIV